MNMSRLPSLFRKSWSTTPAARVLFSQIISLAILTLPVVASADKSSSMLTVEKIGPNQYTVTVHVEHEGNNFFHFTDWVTLFSNGKEMHRWEYTWKKRPENENFKVAATITVTEPTILTSLSHCNLHGSDKKKQGRLELTPD